jgi:hypothetical protein
MFHLAVVLDSGDVVGGGLDTQDEAEFVVDLDRGPIEVSLGNDQVAKTYLGDQLAEIVMKSLNCGFPEFIFNIYPAATVSHLGQTQEPG